MTWCPSNKFYLQGAITCIACFVLAAGLPQLVIALTLDDGALPAAILAPASEVRVLDGDTIQIKGTRYRLYGIDCPEKKQAFGFEAKAAVEEILKNVQDLRIEKMGHERYGRTLAVIHVDEDTLQNKLVRQGYAWVYTRYCRDMRCAKWIWNQSLAKRERVGLWMDDCPMPPWQWRKKHAASQPKNI